MPRPRQPALSAVVLTLAVATAGSAAAEQMIGAPPGAGGLMCRDETALADLTRPDGSAKVDFEHPNSPAMREYQVRCRPVSGGEEVTVITRRRQTSVVTYQGSAWFVPNIDFMTLTSDCIKPETKVSLTGTVALNFKRTDEVDPRKGYRYPRLELDKPICFLGNQARNADPYVSLVGISSQASTAMMAMTGRHVMITGTLETPDNGNQPPDNMMMFDPRIQPAP